MSVWLPMKAARHSPMHSGQGWRHADSEEITEMSADAALLVIDAQKSFRHRPYFLEEQVPAYAERR
ncbi:hypothetical protein [Dokdonella ginsengisoli]|uniref:Isochorismatase family protein n=1 Tax=Dokdonella ginsengisoli TaxID=363846 RepID=A0ABV9QWI4_9GAMM